MESTKDSLTIGKWGENDQEASCWTNMTATVLQTEIDSGSFQFERALHPTQTVDRETL